MNTTENTNGAGETLPNETQRFQGGLTNDELRAEFARKLPNVAPTERDLSVFALGVEVGAGGGIEWELYQLEGIGMVRRRKASPAGAPVVDECGTCRKALPAGCNTEFQGEQSCALTHGVQEGGKP